LIDELMDAYVEWREECRFLLQAYENWADFPMHERELAFARIAPHWTGNKPPSAVYSECIERFQREIDSNPCGRLVASK